MTNQKRMSPDARRQQLLDMAVEVFAEKGIGEARHADIARLAGVSVGTTFVYFPTREALVQDVLSYVGDKLMGLLDGASGSDMPLEDLLMVLSERVLAMTESHTDIMRLWLSWSTHFGPDIRASYLNFLNEDLTRVTAILHRGAGPEAGVGRDDARILVSMTQALVQMKFDGEDPAKLTRFTQHAIDMLMAYRQKHS